MRLKLLSAIAGALVLLTALAAAFVGTQLAPGALHPVVRPLTVELKQRSLDAFQKLDATAEDFPVRAPDGILLRGWKVRAAVPNGSWVLLFHGQSDNRAGMSGQAQLLLCHGYSVVMMDSRAHGESEGAMATYGWLERRDAKAVMDALYATEPQPSIVFAIGSSMGASIALQVTGIDSRIAAVIAESPFSNFREATYDYAGLHWSPWLGKTLFRPAVWTGLPALEKQGGFSADDVSPEKAVANRAFPVLLICDRLDDILPCHHAEAIFKAASGPKELWEVPNSGHASAIGTAPVEYENRVLGFFERLRSQASLPTAHIKGTATQPEYFW
jgi:pimeloyl-ACP methyl ester carboxylesterase